jgi:Flp pilus assembly pilin Flp
MLKRIRLDHARRLRGDSSGAVAIEYALLVVLIGLVLISLHESIGASVSGFFMSVATGL